MTDIGLLIIRLVLGGIFIAHGSQKLFGWFGGRGIKGAIVMMEKMGARPAPLWGVLAGLAEFGGGVLTLLGLLNPLGSLGIIAAMTVAIVQVHWVKGFWNTKGGIEFPLINLTSALALALIGPGAFSLDTVLKIALPEPLALLVCLVLVILGSALEQASLVHKPVQAGDVKQHG